MNFLKKYAIVFACGVLFFELQSKVKIGFVDAENGFESSLKIKSVVGSDYSRGASLFNTTAVGAFGDLVDESVVQRAKIDFTGHISHEEGMEAQGTLRMRVPFGKYVNFTSSDPIKLNQTLFGNHVHSLNLNVAYLQELWVDYNYYESHSITLGIFSFSVGRGIALGDAFAVNPASLGYYSDKTVDMYAPGGKLTGDFFTSKIKYDLYGAVLKNRSSNFKETGQLIYDQVIINQNYASSFCLGFGRVDWLSAARLQCVPYENKKTYTKTLIEPYIVYASDPTQQVNVPFDANGKLVTFGMACEFSYEAVEFGFDAAVNRGRQNVYGWDNNLVIMDTTGAQVFSNVYTDATLKTKLAYDPKLAYIVRPTGPLSSSLNGKQIDETGYYNGKGRFLDPYQNKYTGWMAVADASVYIRGRDLKASFGLGATSGDSNPSQKTGSVRDYNGFVPLQEMYAGKRVKSFFVLGPASSVFRPAPFNDDDSSQQIQTVDGFTNIIFSGVSLTYMPSNWSQKMTFNPNILNYWSYGNTYNATQTAFANKYMGIELNLFSRGQINDNLACNVLMALFVPGKHYADIAGTPLGSQGADLRKLEQVGLAEILPTISDDTAFALSLGFEYLI